MKRIFLLVVLFTTALVQSSSAQAPSQTSALLPLYYSIKDALVKGDAVLASSKAAEFSKAANGAESKQIPEASREALLKGSNQISESKDLKKQREEFSAFSDNMIALAKAAKLSAEPVYVQYCPMKKASWLSSDKAVKNPYYGSAMLTCGKVSETL